MDEQHSYVLFTCDKDNIDEDKTWREIPKDQNLLQRFDVAEYDLDVPLIFYVINVCFELETIELILVNFKLACNRLATSLQ